MACQRSVPVRLDVGRPAGGIQGPGVVPARTLAQIGQAPGYPGRRHLDLAPADSSSGHPETSWTALTLACPGGSVDGLGRRQPSHRATQLPIDRYNNDGRGAFTSSQRWVQGLRCGEAHECSRRRRIWALGGNPVGTSRMAWSSHAECPSRPRQSYPEAGDSWPGSSFPGGDFPARFTSEDVISPPRGRAQTLANAVMPICVAAFPCARFWLRNYLTFTLSISVAPGNAAARLLYGLLCAGSPR